MTRTVIRRERENTVKRMCSREAGNEKINNVSQLETRGQREIIITHSRLKNGNEFRGMKTIHIKLFTR